MSIVTEYWFEVGDDFEAAARRAVAEEAGELARLEASFPDALPPPVAREVPAERPGEAEHPEVATRLALIREQAGAIGGLHPESTPRLEVIYRQVEAIEDLQVHRINEHVEAVEGLHRELAARLELIKWQDRALGEFRTVLVLLRESQVYRVMLALGRWGWLDRRIRRVLRT